jgi:hypothetical protein
MSLQVRGASWHQGCNNAFIDNGCLIRVAHCRTFAAIRGRSCVMWPIMTGLEPGRMRAC